MQEREKSSTDELHTRFAVEFFLSYESLKSRKRRIFLPTSYIQGQEIQEAKEAVEFRQGWSAAKNKGDVKKKRRRPRKVVCRHKKGTWERRKEEDQGRWSVATRRGCEKEEKRKRPRKARRWLREGKVPCVLNQEISFFGSQVFGFGSSPSRVKYWLLRDLVYEEAMCKGSSGNGQPYTAKAVP